MQEMIDLMRSSMSQWVYRHAMSNLTGHPLGAAKNAFSYIERAHFVSEKYPTLAYFCITHATEEAAVCLVQTAREKGYSDDIKKFSKHIHRHKAVVTYFAQQIGDYLSDIPLKLAIMEDRDLLCFRNPQYDPPIDGVMSLDSFKFFNENGHEDYDSPTMFLDELRNDKASTVLYVNNLAEFRDRALYAEDMHPPGISPESMKSQLLMHTKLTLGMIWVAQELCKQTAPLPFVQRVFRDMDELVRKVDRKPSTKPSIDPTATSANA